MNSPECNVDQELQREYFPYLIAQAIGYILAICIAFGQESVAGGLSAVFFGGPLAALLARIIVMIYRIISLIISVFIISGPLSFLLGGSLLMFLIPALRVSQFGSVCILVFFDIISLWILYRDIFVFFRGEKPNIQPQIRQILIATLIVLGVVFAGLVYTAFRNGEYSDNPPSIMEETTVATENPVLQVYADVFAIDNQEYLALLEQSLEASVSEEQEALSDGDEIIEPSEVYASVFAKVKNPEDVHTDFGSGVKMQNALMVVTAYKRLIGRDFEQTVWTVWIYPDFYNDPNEGLLFNRDNVYDYGFLCDSLEEAMEFVKEEFDDMEFTELELPG